MKFNKIFILIAIVFLLGILFSFIRIYNYNKEIKIENSINCNIPINYSCEDYGIIEVYDNNSCKTDVDCRLPFNYAIRSNCPYTIGCIENKCTVICPKKIFNYVLYMYL